MELNQVKIDEPISVILVSNSKTNKAKPVKLKWRNREYSITEVVSHMPGLMEIKGVPHHIYTIQCGETWMEIALNVKTLQWRLLKMIAE